MYDNFLEAEVIVSVAVMIPLILIYVDLSLQCLSCLTLSVICAIGIQLGLSSKGFRGVAP